MSMVTWLCQWEWAVSMVTRLCQGEYGYADGDMAMLMRMAVLMVTDMS